MSFVSPFQTTQTCVGVRGKKAGGSENTAEATLDATACGPADLNACFRS
jgi:hypothetical protein